MPSQKKKEYKFPISPEKQREQKLKKEAVESERVRIVLRMMVHGETDFKISLYTGFSFKKIRYIREHLLGEELESIRAKNEMMEKCLRMQDPPPGMRLPWQHL